ncbi:MAG: cardiolipin synthase [Brumimicrobium sp.]
MNWLILLEVVYIIILILVCLRIIYDTRTTTKTLAYLLLAVFVPIFGIIFYFIFGINYRNRKMYSKKLYSNEEMANEMRIQIHQYSKRSFAESKAIVRKNKELAFMLVNDTNSPLTSNNNVELHINGEEKFPDVINVLKSAKHHIHLEYYIYENDEIGREIEEILIQKAKEGVSVRFIYDDFGSRAIGKNLVKRLRKNGVQAYPFLKIHFIFFANRLNYRNHRKIIIVDGETAFVGGINVGDRYINQPKNKLYWRDTHLKIEGPGVFYLQYIFLCDWNFCANEKLKPNDSFFPPELFTSERGNKIVQIAASGPDSDTPTILFSILKTINLATKEILITNPYFIPGESLSDALVIAALSGIKVKLLVPGISDSKIVNTAAKSYYSDLLEAGVEVYLYKRGFVHAKTMVADEKISIVGTSNMDIRSFDLNFEVNAIVYDKEISRQLRDSFYEDLKYADQINLKEWNNRSTYQKMLEKIARLVSPIL